jgi:hypothetical protein
LQLMAERLCPRLLQLLGRLVGSEDVEEPERDVHRHENRESRRQLPTPRTGACGCGSFTRGTLHSAMNLPRGDELALQFGVGNERPFEAFSLGRRHLALQVIEKFFGRHDSDLFWTADYADFSDEELRMKIGQGGACADGFIKLLIESAFQFIQIRPVKWFRFAAGGTTWKLSRRNG